MKRYLVIHPALYTEEQESKLETKARAYYGEKDYRQCTTIEQNQEEIVELTQKLIESECLSDLFLLALNTMVLSQVDSVYLARDWEDDEFCKMLHMFAFKYGIDIVYELV